MYPNQGNHPPPGAPYSSPYPQQPPYNMSGMPPQQGAYGNPTPYGGGAGLSGPYQSNMSGPYGGNPQGGNPYAHGSNPPGANPYGQGSHPPGGNPYGQGPSPYGQGSNPSAGNPYAQGGYGAPGGSNMPGAYPPSSGQQPYGNSPYGQNNPGAYGSGYPPGSSSYPPAPGNFQSHGGAYPPPPQGGAFPGQQTPYSSQGGYPPGGYGAPGGGPVNPGGSAVPMEQRSQRLNQVIRQYEINPQFASRLQALANCEIVVLCDDSGSMNASLQGTNQTRWDELKSIVNIVVDIASTMDSNGVDVHFLNRDPIPNVTNVQNVRHIFNRPPEGLTPLVPALRRIFASKRGLSFEKKLFILIATDGAPTNEHGQPDVASLEAVLRHERTPQTYVTFLACTDDLESVSYLSRWDKALPNLDVIDDYRSELGEIQRTRGQNFPFSFGDYIVKALLGSMDPWFDSLDERA